MSDARAADIALDQLPGLEKIADPAARAWIRLNDGRIAALERAVNRKMMWMTIIIPFLSEVLSTVREALGLFR